MNGLRLSVVSIVALTIGMVMMGCAHLPGTKLRALLPPLEMHGWKAQEPDEIYHANTLYKYINGAAEVYRSFNVKKVLARRYMKEGAPEIIVDVFDMGSSSDAFGVYHHTSREDPDIGIGQESEYTGTSLFFWKDRYFVSVMAFGDTNEAKQAVLELGKSVDGAIHEEGSLPELLSVFPKTMGAPQDVRYFHNHWCLNMYYFLSDENLLQLKDKTEGVLARYASTRLPSGSPESSPVVVMLIRYTSPGDAERALCSFMSGYLPDTDAQGAARTENGLWSMAHVSGTFLIGVFDAGSRADSIKLVSFVEKALTRNSRETGGENND